MKYVELAEGEVLREEQLTRQGVLPANIMQSAAEIVARVREEGDAVLRELSAKFDGVEVDCFRVPQEELDAALDRVDERFVASIEQAARQIRDFHARELQQSWFTIL